MELVYWLSYKNINNIFKLENINKNMKKKYFWSKWWFWLIIIFLIFVTIYISFDLNILQTAFDGNVPSGSGYHSSGKI